MQVTVSKKGVILFLALAGRLDASTPDEFETHLLSLIANGETHLVFDLAQVEYISSGALRVLLRAFKQVMYANGRMAFHLRGQRHDYAQTQPDAARVGAAPLRNHRDRSALRSHRPPARCRRVARHLAADEEAVDRHKAEILSALRNLLKNEELEVAKAAERLASARTLRRPEFELSLLG